MSYSDPVLTLEQQQALLERLAAMEQRIVALETELEEWRQGVRTRPARQRRRANQDDNDDGPGSGTTDAQKPRRRRRSGRKKGHKGAGRTRPPAADRTVVCTLDACPDCRGHMRDVGIAGQRFVEDIVLQVQTTCYQRRKYRCDTCRKTQRAPLPPRLGGAPRVGPNAQALATWLRWNGRMTVGQVARFFNAIGLRWTPGAITQMFERNIDKLVSTLHQVWRELLDEPVLFIDETGWKEDGKRHWLHVALGEKTSCFLLSPNRDRESFQALVPADWGGLRVTDGWSAYESLREAEHAGCWAHVLRKIRDECEVHGRVGDQEMFRQVKAFWKEAEAYQAGWDSPRGPPREQRCRLEGRFEQLVWAGHSATSEKLQKVARWLEKKRARMLLFLRRGGVPLENNRAERELRPAVIVRKTSFGTRTPVGSVVFADWLTVTRSLSMRGGDLLAFLPWAFEELGAGRAPTLNRFVPA